MNKKNKDKKKNGASKCELRSKIEIKKLCVRNRKKVSVCMSLQTYDDLDVLFQFIFNIFK